jgi:UDP-N-acetylmuramoyl-tripeptide--D-alanyl-D-alanine ligase
MLHRRLGEQVFASGQDHLICVGPDAHAIAEGALAAGMRKASVECVGDIGAAHTLLRGLLRRGDRLLCKASRRVALDRLVDLLLVDLSAGDADGRAEAGS